MSLERLSDREAIILGKKLGTGGEATIYEVDLRLAAKIYHRPAPARTAKLAAMAANPPEDPMKGEGLISIAWPVDLLQEHGTVTGFLMPRVSGKFPIIDFYHLKTRRERYPLFNYTYLHSAVRNLAVAVQALHLRGYVIGDVNESNILVSDTTYVTLVDTDSFQVRGEDGAIYRSPVGKPEFTPPELQGKKFSEIDRSPEHDCFGLAVLIFQMLMEGVHPFAGIFEGRGDPPPIQERIAAGHFPYSRHRAGPYRPMRGALAFDVLSPEIQGLFRACFEDGHADPRLRPTPRTWKDALGRAVIDLGVCPVNGEHRYGKHLPGCPWCERKKLLGYDPFPSREEVAQGAHRPRPKPQRAVVNSPVPIKSRKSSRGSRSRPVSTTRKVANLVGVWALFAIIFLLVLQLFGIIPILVWIIWKTKKKWKLVLLCLSLLLVLATITYRDKPSGTRRVSDVPPISREMKPALSQLEEHIKEITPPHILVEKPLSGSHTRSRQITLQGTVDDPAVKTVTADGHPAKVVGGKFSIPLWLPGEEGEKEIDLAAITPLTISRQSITVVYDATPPKIEVAGPSPGEVLTNTPVELRGKVVDRYLEKILVNGAAIDVEEGMFSHRIDLVDGKNKLRLLAKDRAGNESEIELELTADLGLPQFELYIPGDRSVSDRTITVNGRLGDKWQKLYIDGIDVAEGRAREFSYDLRLPIGENHIRVVAEDRFHRKSEKVVTVTRTSAIKLELLGPQQVRVGKSRYYEVAVHNIGKTELKAVELVLDLPQGCWHTKSGWDRHTLEPGQKRILRYKVRVERPGEFVHTVRAEVESDPCASVEIGVRAVPEEESWVPGFVHGSGLPQAGVDEMLYSPADGGEILDMASPAWAALGYERQAKLAGVYQDAYARYLGEPIEQPLRKDSAIFTMILIPPGRFWMGSPGKEKSDESRRSVVIRRPFWLGKSEVTQRQWQTVMKYNPSGFPSENLPVETVSWNDCKKFLDKTDLSFPTEAEWEYACRAGSTGKYSWGDDAELLTYFACHNTKANVGPSPVGQKRPNAFGLYDMHGNVWEWCEDAWDIGVIATYVENAVDPVSDNGENRILRGGSFVDAPDRCRSAYRLYNPHNARNYVYGLRVARPASR